MEQVLVNLALVGGAFAVFVAVMTLAKAGDCSRDELEAGL